MIMSSNGNIFSVTGFCAGNSPVTSEFPTQRPVTRSFDIFFDLPLNKRSSKQAGDLRRHRAHNDVVVMTRLWPGTTLVQVITNHMLGDKPLPEYWLIFIWSHGNTLQWNLNGDFKHSIQNAFGNMAMWNYSYLTLTTNDSAVFNESNTGIKPRYVDKPHRAANPGCLECLHAIGYVY